MADLSALLAKSNSVDVGNLLGIKERARREMNESPTKANIAAYEAARKALDAAVHSQGARQAENDVDFSSLEEVRRHLEAKGYKISKSTINRHKHEGYILPANGGVFTDKTVIRYKNFLTSKGLGPVEAKADASGPNNRFLAARADKMEQEALLLRLKTQAEQGRYVPRAKVEQDLAARAMMLKSGFRHLIQSTASELVYLVGGDPAKTRDLILELTQRVDRVLSDYASADSVVLVFTGPEDTPDDAPSEAAEEQTTNAEEA
jgi:hypothetical protein